MEEKVRVRVRISGRVQGVCFRMETQRAAGSRRISGWVRNRPDGTVEAVFEGKPADVGDMLTWCRQGPPLSRVDQVDVQWERSAGECSRFEITY